MEFTTLFILIVIGLFDSLDPIPFVVIMSIMSKKNWFSNFIFFIVPYWLLYFAFGVVLMFLGNQINEFQLTDLPYAVYALKALGMGIFFYGLYIIIDRGKKKNRSDKKNLEKDSVWKYLLMSIALIVSNMPFAYPYFGIISELLRNKAALPLALLYIFIYTVAFIFPYILFVWAYKKYEHRAKAVLQKIIDYISHKYVTGGVLMILGGYLFLVF